MSGSNSGRSGDQLNPPPKGAEETANAVIWILLGPECILNHVKPQQRSARFKFTSKVSLPRSRQEIFEFFSDAQNLDKLTPPWLHFKILTEMPIKLEKGALIDYRLRIRGVPIRWRTEIEVWEPPFRFIDRQLRGPYRVWIHEHQFFETDDGTLMLDTVDYDVWGGRLIDRLLVRNDVERVFDYRRDKITQLFGNGRMA